MWPHLTDFFGNPSSSHHYSAEPRWAPAEARAQVAALVGARADEAVFTASGSEADLLALCGTALAHGCGALFHCDAAQAVGKIPSTSRSWAWTCSPSYGTRCAPRRVRPRCTCATGCGWSRSSTAAARSTG
ncbi:hypothetical protein ACH4S9_32110 [Streptomyces sp. NPDC021225]